MSQEFRRWSIYGLSHDSDHWVEICRCDNEHAARQLAQAVFLKGYERVSIGDNYRELVREDGSIDTFGLLEKISGKKLNIKYVSASEMGGAE
jgi:hypothetical protein